MRKVPGALRNFLLTVVVGGVAVGACLAALLPGIATVGAAHHFTSDKLGELRDLKQRSTIFDSHGNKIAVLGLQNREDASLDEVPQVIQDAIIASEDQTFWSNDGVDLNATMRAFLKNLTSGKIVQGGSTITQQLVKNRILTPKRDLKRKLREELLAVRLTDQFS